VITPRGWHLPFEGVDVAKWATWPASLGTTSLRLGAARGKRRKPIRQRLCCQGRQGVRTAHDGTRKASDPRVLKPMGNPPTPGGIPWVVGALEIEIGLATTPLPTTGVPTRSGTGPRRRDAEPQFARMVALQEEIRAMNAELAALVPPRQLARRDRARLRLQ